MSRDVTWVEACAQVLEGSAELWLSAAEIYHEMKRRRIKDISYVTYGAGVRSIRSNLNCHSKKTKPSFYRSEEGGIKYALKKRLDQGEVHTDSKEAPDSNTRLDDNAERLDGKVERVDAKRLSRTPSPLCNGVASGSEQQQQQQPPLTVEIDPRLKPERSLKQLEASGLLLPSPLHSLLAPGRTLSMMVASGPPASRPVRKVRKKSHDRRIIKTSSSSPPPPVVMADGHLPPITQPAPRHRVPSLSADIVCLQGGSEDWDGCTVQGWRPEVESFEIDPDRISDSDSSSYLSDEGDEDGEGCGIPLQPTPSQQLLVRRSSQPLPPPPPSPPPPPLPPHSSSDDEDTPTFEELAPPTVNKSSKPRSVCEVKGVRLGANPLFGPTSQLVNENIKTLLSRKAFDGLHPSQKRALIELLPAIDRADDLSSRPREDALSNIFFSSALREWQDRLAIGAFTPEYRARERAERKKAAASLSSLAWKEKHYEEYWGERSLQLLPVEEEYEALFYPAPSSLTPGQRDCLSAITAGYSRDPPPSTPPPPPSPPPPLPPSTDAAATATKTESKPAPVKASSKKNAQNVSTVVRNHYLKAKPTIAVKSPTKKSPVKKRLSSNPTKPLQRFSMNHRLTALPPKTPYRELLASLAQGAKRSSAALARPWSLDQPPSAQHSHHVFLDHFSLLSGEHVPLEFSGPVTSLPVSLPLSFYVSCLQRKAAASDHCYTPSASPPSLTLSVPRSLLHRPCVCSRQPLAFCSQCHAMFHRACTTKSLCFNCTLSRIP